MYAYSAPGARNIIADLAARGQHHFTVSELRPALGVSAAAARQALSRLGARGEIASPARGLYVIVPPEYRQLGCLPADQFISALMECRNIRYAVWSGGGRKRVPDESGGRVFSSTCQEGVAVCGRDRMAASKV